MKKSATWSRPRLTCQPISASAADRRHVVAPTASQATQRWAVGVWKERQQLLGRCPSRTSAGLPSPTAATTSRLSALTTRAARVHEHRRRPQDLAGGVIADDLPAGAEQETLLVGRDRHGGAPGRAGRMGNGWPFQGRAVARRPVADVERRIVGDRPARVERRPAPRPSSSLALGEREVGRSARRNGSKAKLDVQPVAPKTPRACRSGRCSPRW